MNAFGMGIVKAIGPVFTTLLLLANVCRSEAQSFQGKWIWQPDDGPANTWVCFRKTLDVPAVPGKVPTLIAVDSKYWLWINGEPALFEGGLKRGPTPEDTYVDTLDLGPYLVPGRNVLALLVWHFGKHGYSHKNSGKGGLFFECRIGDSLVISDSTWKLCLHPGFQQASGLTSDRRLPESNIRYHAGMDTLGNWTSVSYNDSAWIRAVEKGIPPAAPWNSLYPRPIPQWKNSGLVDYQDLSVELPYTAAAPTQIVAKLPYNAQVTPYFEITATVSDTLLMYTDNRNRIAHAVAAEYITRPGIQQFESPGWMNGHRVIYRIPQGITVTGLKYRETGYPAELTGSFTCNDSFYNTLWKKGQRTLYVNMRDNLMDCPDRERALWWGDATIESGQAFYAVDRRSDLLTAKSLLNLIAWQKDDGVLYAPVPSGNWDFELPLQILAAIGRQGCWNYFLHSGDTALLREVYPGLKKYMALWSTGEDGLVQHRSGGWDWKDWGKNTDTRVLENCWYYMAVGAVRNMAVLSGYAGDTSGYDLILESMRDNFHRTFWNNDEYRSPEHYGATDDRANALAVVAGLADTSQWPGIRVVLQNQYHASPYMEKFVLEALFIMGYAGDALNRMKHEDRYGAMVNDTLSTLYEFFGNEGTCNHGWSGGPLTLLSQYCAGVAPEQAGYARFHVYPQEGPLRSLKAMVPSVRGNITVEMNKDSLNYTLDVTVPEYTSARIGIPRLPFSNKTPGLVRVNQDAVWANGIKTDDHGPAVFAGVTKDYLCFTADPGSYRFSASLRDTLVEVRNRSGTVNSGIQLFPNPAGDFIRVQLPAGNELPAEMIVYDMQGRMIYHIQLISREELIHITSLGRGVYMVKVQDGHEVMVIKLVKTYGPGS